MRFSDKRIITRLLESGWFDGRNILKNLEFPIEGYPLDAKKFLQEYGLLKVQDVEYDNEYQRYIASYFEINPMIGKGHYDSDGDFTYYSSILGKQIFNLGYFKPDGYYICCDVDGRVYKIGEYCFCVGGDLYEGIENILLMNTLKSLQLDEDTGKWWNMDGEYVKLP